jgi:hypothetical protein
LHVINRLDKAIVQVVSLLLRLPEPLLEDLVLPLEPLDFLTVTSRSKWLRFEFRNPTRQFQIICLYQTPQARGTYNSGKGGFSI